MALLRRIYTFVSILSVALLVATMAFWVRSHFRSDTISCQIGGSVHHPFYFAGRIESSRGGLFFTTYWTTWDRVAADQEDMPTSFRWEADLARGGYGYVQRPWLNFWKSAYEYKEQYPIFKMPPGEGCGLVFTVPASEPGLLRQVWGFAFPYWLVVISSALISVPSFIGIGRAQRRELQGLCAVCGYDLRETPDRCPECGIPFSSPCPVSSEDHQTRIGYLVRRDVLFRRRRRGIPQRRPHRE